MARCGYHLPDTDTLCQDWLTTFQPNYVCCNTMYNCVCHPGVNWPRITLSATRKLDHTHWCSSLQQECGTSYPTRMTGIRRCLVTIGYCRCLDSLARMHTSSLLTHRAFAWSPACTLSPPVGGTAKTGHSSDTLPSIKLNHSAIALTGHSSPPVARSLL